MRGLLVLGALWSLALAEKAEPLAKRDAMLSPRQRTCRTPGWIPVCPGAFPCIPPGGVCCDDGITYVMPPETCPEGTSPIATAVTGSVAPSITTPPPVPTTLPPVTQYEWYTWTIRITYYYYYYTYFAFSAQLTSTQTIYTTIGSLTASNDAQATALIGSISSSIEAAVQATQSATPTVGSIPVSTQTPANTGTKTLPYPTGANTTVPQPPTAKPSQFTGAAASVRAGTAAFFGSFALIASAFCMIAPGVLMVWL